MSGQIIYTPATGADWATAWEQAEYTRKGKFGLSLTNYNNTSLPAIASGSWCEVAGSIYKWTSEEAISGSLSSSAVNYIKLVPSGSGDTAIVTATWTTSAPTWSDAYQGYYSGTSRYVAQRGPRTQDITFNQDGEKLAVSMMQGGRQGAEPTEVKGEGTVKGNDIEFKITRTTPGGESTTTYKGKIVDDNNMTITSESSRGGQVMTMEWKAVRKPK